ncbi:energy-coupling factor transporter transmembrane protein EcfT [Paenibacillus sp. TRM 82003]|nr:energy-coupling factor transporter transmembrane protein EcfT [Paenibacillus sp. TRM 82003]
MRETIKLGRFVAADSWVHRLDPRSKLAAMLLYFGVVLSIDSLPALGVTAAVSLIVMFGTGIPLGSFLRALKPLRFLLAFAFLFPLLLEPNGLLAGTLAAGRMALFVAFTAILTFTTDTSALTSGLESLLRPFRALGLSPERWTLMMTITLRFIPTILDEADTVLKAQASRGADFRDLPWKARARMLITLLVPVTASSFRRASDLVDAMQARGYRHGAPRTAYRELRWTAADTAFIAMFTIFLIGMIFL